MTRLVAPILAANAEAVSFYSGAGFGAHGVILAVLPDQGSHASVAPF